MRSCAGSALLRGQSPTLARPLLGPGLARRGATIRAVAAWPRRQLKPPRGCTQPKQQQQRQRQQQQRRQGVVAAATAGAGDGAASGASAGSGLRFSPTLAGLVCTVLALGVLNRVLYKIALVPLGPQFWVLAQLVNFGYILIYGALVALRYSQKQVTADMLALPKLPFVATGALEAVAQLLMLAGASRLPGALLPLLMQTALFWNLAFSALLLGMRPTLAQLLGVFLVAAGVAIASLPPPAALGGAPAAAALLSPGDGSYVALCVLSFAFPTLAVVIKQLIFEDARKRLAGRELEVVVVNFFGSVAQAVFVIALMPFLTALRGLPLAALPSVLADGARALAGGDAAGYALGYVGVNVAFNIAALTLVRSTSAVTSSLTMAAQVPLAVLAFTLPWPLLQPAALGPAFWGGVATLMAGLAAYNWRTAGGKE